MRTLLASFLADRSGATAIEYAMIASLIFVVIVVAVAAVGEGQTNMFNYIGGYLSAALGSAEG